MLIGGYGYPISGVVNQQWDELTGRAVANWTPKLDFTDQTLVYASYSHGYKAGGANPPGAVFLTYATGDNPNPIHPATFKPEFIDAFELGTKNTLLDGSLTLNGDVFYYNYENYQISEIVDRSAINLNFNAHIKGAEIEGTWESVPGLRFQFRRWLGRHRACQGFAGRRSDGQDGGQFRLDGDQAVPDSSIELHHAALCPGRRNFRRC